MTFLRNNRGFTLIELMIVVAIVGVLASIALPAYNEQVAKGRRTTAKVQLLAAQQWMERFYSENYRYDQNSAGTLLSDTDSPFLIRFPATPAAADGAESHGIELVTPLLRDSFVLRATRTVGSNMALDRCGNLTLDSLGRKGIIAGTFDRTKFADVQAAIRYCWS